MGDAYYPAMLAVVFGIVHHLWAVRMRSRLAGYLANHVPGLSKSRAHDIQNWIVRIVLPAAIVLSQGSSVEILGFRIPMLTIKDMIVLVFLTIILFPIDLVILWYAVSRRDEKTIEAVKNWSIKRRAKDSIIGSLLWALPEECFLRGYLISQLSAIGNIPALLVSTFFTAIIHGSRGKFWILLSVFTGLFFGIAFIITGSLLPSFIMHVMVNELFTRIQAARIRRWLEDP
ncbi:MAG: CPBP family intramembrane glutamic endopeptidase [Thermoproteota archaeon]